MGVVEGGEGGRYYGVKVTETKEEFVWGGGGVGRLV